VGAPLWNPFHNPFPTPSNPPVFATLNWNDDAGAAVVSWPKCLAVLPFILQVSEHNGQLPVAEVAEVASCWLQVASRRLPAGGTCCALWLN